MSINPKKKLTSFQKQIHRQLKETTNDVEVEVAASIYMTSVLKYIIAEILEQAGNVAQEQKKTRILLSHIEKAVITDRELNTLFPINTPLGDFKIVTRGTVVSIPSKVNRLETVLSKTDE